MPGIHSRGAKARLVAYIFLVCATTFSLWLLRDYIDNTHALVAKTRILAIQTQKLSIENKEILAKIQEERKTRLSQSKTTALIVCNQVETVKKNLKITIDSNVADSIALDQKLNKKFHFYSPQLLRIIITQARKQLKKYDQTLEPYNCNHLPLVKIRKQTSTK